MKKSILALCAAFVFAFSAIAAQNDTLRILAIGNSFSQDAVNENFGELCVAAGKHVIVGNLYIGGCSLERHWKSLTEKIPDYTYHKRVDDGKMSSTPKQLITVGIFDEPWDIVTFQQASPKSPDFTTYEPFLGKLVAYIKANVPSAKRLMWHQTWAYHSKSNRAPIKTFGGQKGMYDGICGASKAACEKYGLEVIPSGTTIQNIKSSYDNENCHRDGSHLSFTMGRYAAACAWFEAIFHENVEGNTYCNPNLTRYRGELAQSAAHLAFQKPFEQTNMTKLGFCRPAPNTDESKVPAYTLPDALKMQDGTPVRNKTDWMEKRRPELLALFEKEMFGKAPAAPESMKFEVRRSRKDALDGKATCKEVRIHFTKEKDAFIDLILYTPNSVKKAPVFLGINFKGNDAISDDPWISKVAFSTRKHGIYDNIGGGRGVAAHRWPLEEIIGAGYGVATFYRGDASPDTDNSRNLGVIKYMKAGKEYDWATIAAWAWSLSRALDYLETDSDVDASKVAVFGHSRLGKTALWAGATDPRFAMVISNDSGCCGAAISRRHFGETVAAINMYFPHWFCENFKKYNEKEDELPFDQHELLALIAPRPLCVASATEDLWADPKGEKLALEEAGKVYKLFGGKQKTFYHIREGKHNILLEDWQHYIAVADKFLKK